MVIRPVKVEWVVLLTVTLYHLEGVSRCVLGVRILGRGDEVVIVARVIHRDSRNRDRSGSEVDEGKKETEHSVLTQCIV